MKDKMTENKLGKAGRFYLLTPKAHKFVRDFKRFCARHGIHENEITKFLVYLVKPEPEQISFKEGREYLIEKGYLRSSDVTQEEPK